MNKIFATIALLFMVILSQAQSNPLLDSVRIISKGIPPKPIKYAKWGLGVQFSTNGLGLQIARSIHPTNKLVVKLGGNYLPIKIQDHIIDFSGTKTVSNININLGSVGAYLDWHPFGNAFKLTGGCAYLFSNISGNSSLMDSLDQGELRLEPEKVGVINYGIKTRPIAPFVAFGFGRAIPKRRVGFGFELGTYYIGPPRVSFKCTGLLEPTSENEALLNENLKGYQWLPVLNLNLTIKLK